MKTPAFLLLLWVTTFCYLIVKGSSSSHAIGKWKEIANLSEDNGWYRNWPVWAPSRLHKQNFRSVVNIALYRRNATSPETAKSRLLFIDLGGFTWTYSPRTRTWTKLLTSTGNERSAAEASFAFLFRNTITTLCECRIVVVGGSRLALDGTLTSTNESWLFDGESETWSHLPTATQFFLGDEERHATFVYRQEESTCHCKDSLFVYAAKDDGVDLISERVLWELRCIDDRDAKNIKYEWIESVFDTTLWPVAHAPLASLSAFAANSTRVYWLSSQTPDTINVSNTVTGNWSAKKVVNSCPYENYILYSNNSIRDALFFKRKLLISVVSYPGRFLGVYDLEASSFKCIFLAVADVSRTFGNTRNLLFVDETFFHVIIDNFDQAIAFETFPETELFGSLHENNGTRASARSSLSLPHDATNPLLMESPLLVGDYRLVGVSDSIGYLMISGYYLQMWQIDLDLRRLTLYDPEQIPEAKTNSLEVAASGAKKSFVAYFGGENGFSVSGQDKLWIYSTRMRTWTRVASHGYVPRKMTSYATMNSLSNGSLILFGGIDNETNSLLMAVVDYERMTASWETLFSDVSQQQPNELRSWTSAIWSNRFYVFFGQRAIPNCEAFMFYELEIYMEIRRDYICHCDMSIYYIDFEENGALEWKTKRQNISTFTFCKVQQAAYGRFAYTRNERNNFLLADLDQMEYRIENENKLRKGWEEILFARNNEVLSISPSLSVLPFENVYRNDYLIRFARLRRLKLTGCEPGSFSPEYSITPCQLCPKGEYSDQYGATNCSSCPPNLVTSAMGSNSIDNCTCASTTCVNGNCIVQSDHTTLCICNGGFTGKRCETPTMYLVGIGITVGILLAIAFYYCIKRVKKTQNGGQVHES